MKFLRLDLLAYGPFTNRSLDLPAGGPNLHLIYGPNEAGKSTTLRAISGLLYGIKKDTGDAHRHATTDLRIGARLLHSSGREQTLVRRKGLQGTLVDGKGAAVDESALRAWLSVSDRKQFEMMFGLSHEQLRAAGALLADPKSPVGEMLFGAALDGTTLQKTLQRLEGEADKLLSAAGSAGAVHKALAAYRDQLKRAKDGMVPARDWESLRAEIEAAEVRRDELSKDVVRNATERHRLGRLQRALPWLRQRFEAQQQRAAMGELRLLPTDVGVRRRDVTQALETAAQNVERINVEIARNRQEREALAVPEGLVEFASRMRQLTEDLGKYKTEQRNDPGVVKEIMAHRNTQRETLRQMGLGGLETSAYESIRIEDSAAERIQALEREGLTRQTTLAEARVRHASRAALAAQRTAELAVLPAPPDAAVLESTWLTLRPDPSLDERVQEAEVTVAELDARLREFTRKLRPWSGSPEAAAALEVPSEATMRRFEAEFLGDAQERKRLAAALTERTEACDRIRQTFEQLAEAGPVPSDAELRDARGRRERGWELVVQAWRAHSPPEDATGDFAPGVPLVAAYPAAVSAADEVADRLRRESDRVARMAGLRQDDTAARARCEDARRELSDLEKLCAGRLDAWEEQWRPCGMEPLPPQEMLSWRSRQAELREAIRRRDDAVAVRDRLTRARSEQRQAIDAALQIAGASLPQEAPWLTRILQAERTLALTKARVSAIEALRTTVDALTTEVATEAAKIAEHERGLEAWRVQWNEAVTKLRLPPDALADEANVVLRKLREFFVIEEKCRRQESSLKAIRAQGDQFAKAVSGLAERYGPDLTGSTAEIADALIRRCEESVKSAERRDTLDALRERLVRELDAAGLTHDAEQRRRDALLAETGSPTLAELEVAEARSGEARELDRRRSEAEQRLIEVGEGWSLEALEQEAAGTDSDALEAAIAELVEKHRQVEQEQLLHEQHIGALRQRERGYAGGDTAAQALADAQEHLAVARSQAERCARLRLATAVLRRGVESYRQKNQGPILQRASRLFERLTRGRYEQIQVQYEGDRARLRCVRQGELVEVEDALSDGTLDQLFLSLRLASLEQHLESQEPMPLVLDDIFIHFDDDRASAGLEVLAEMATRTQVLFLTHHARNLDLARTALAPEQWAQHNLVAPSPG